MKGGVILSGTLLIGIVVGVAGTRLVPRAAEMYLPDLWGRLSLIEGHVLKKQREANRVLLKVETAQGPVLVTFTRKVAEIDLLVEPGDVLLLGVPRNQTFVEDPPLESVKRAPSAPSAGGSPPAGRP